MGNKNKVRFLTFDKKSNCLFAIDMVLGVVYSWVLKVVCMFENVCVVPRKSYSEAKSLCIDSKSGDLYLGTQRNKIVRYIYKIKEKMFSKV